MGGTITVESSPGEGSTFRFTTVLGHTTQDISIIRTQDRRGCTDVSFPDKRVLIVEDNEINRDLMTDMLCNLDFQLDAVANGDEALQLLQSTEYDIILMDIHMPRMNGFTAAQKIRRELGLTEVPIIALTARTNPDDTQLCRMNGINELVTKPVNLYKLTEIICRFILPGGAVSKQKAVSSLLPDHLPPFDIAAAMDRFEDNDALLHRSLINFANSYRDTAQEIRVYLLQENWDNALQAVHNLHGAAGTLEARDLANAAHLLEQCIEEKQNDIASHLDILEALLNEAVSAVSVLDSEKCKI